MMTTERWAAATKDRESARRLFAALLRIRAVAILRCARKIEKGCEVSLAEGTAQLLRELWNDFPGMNR